MVREQLLCLYLAAFHPYLLDLSWVTTFLSVLDTTRNPRPGEVDGKGQLTNRQLDCDRLQQADQHTDKLTDKLRLTDIQTARL